MPCAAPVVLPDRALNSGEVQKFWLRDRSALVACGVLDQKQKEFYAGRDAALR